MSQIFNVLNAEGGIKLPIADGTLSTREGLETQNGFSTAQFVISFRDIDGKPVTPTAGTVNPVMSPIEGQIMNAGGDEVAINALEVKASQDGVATYTIPTFIGISNQGFVTFDGIIGADHAVAFFWKT